ncbi:ABC transporter ATP-binding protein [Paenibacillus sp. J31TS4]|uniref:ABC transporter ATP-binding protein n=1 Tax=Paenibacillus sp. J31TS4 TaxID=2807195 RepID=UPI001B1418F8|nr:ABC transporter ATP-binding protein [Paenibacillus sp. J31TS4]GIP37345.1 ABC transporter ATP-binding protein [Paenibacillus sp. J31TS4]
MNEEVRLEGVTHVYVTEQGASLAVEAINLALAPGEFVSLVGPSGCGKTTILSLIAGLLRPTQGAVMVNGRAVSRPDGKVGYMLQSDYLFPWRTILQNVKIGLELTGNRTPEAEERALRLLEEMGLAHTKDWVPQQLSGGMRQRVALVRTLATEPELLLLDEPFSALDYQTKLQLEDLIVETLKKKGKTALLVTHDLAEAIAMSDRVIVLDRHPGRIRREVSIPEDIRKETPFRAREHPDFYPIFNEIWSELEAKNAGGRSRHGEEEDRHADAT